MMSRRKNKRRRKYWKRQTITSAVRTSGEMILKNAEKKRLQKRNIIISICCVCVLFTVVWLLTNIVAALCSLIFLGDALLMGFGMYLFGSEVVSDYRIYHNGSRHAGTCTGTKQLGKTKLLVVNWSENGVQHSGAYTGFSKLCRFPYPVTVYYWKGEANLGAYTLIHDLFYFLILLGATIGYGYMFLDALIHNL